MADAGSREKQGRWRGLADTYGLSSRTDPLYSLGPHGCSIIAFDTPFHGENQVDQSYQDFAADAVAQAQELVDAPIVVAGVSQGGVSAQESARQPGVVGVISISTTRRAADDEERASITGLIDFWGTDGGAQPVAENIAATSTSSQQPAYDETVAAVLAMTKEQMAHTISLLEDRRGGIELATPYLFIHETADQTYIYEDIVANIPADHLVTVEENGHCETRNGPEVVAPALREFALALVEG